MAVQLEHANLTVRDIDATIRFLQTAIPEFRIRFDGIDAAGTRWVHIGTDDTYFTLTQSTLEPSQRWLPYEGLPGVNHLGLVVDDADALRSLLLAGGYQDSTSPNCHPYRKRVYFHDPDDND